MSGMAYLQKSLMRRDILVLVVDQRASIKLWVLKTCTKVLCRTWSEAMFGRSSFTFSNTSDFPGFRWLQVVKASRPLAEVGVGLRLAVHWQGQGRYTKAKRDNFDTTKCWGCPVSTWLLSVWNLQSFCWEQFGNAFLMESKQWFNKNAGMGSRVHFSLPKRGDQPVFLVLVWAAAFSSS